MSGVRTSEGVFCGDERGMVIFIGRADYVSMSSHKISLVDIYRKLLSHFEPQHWWPGETNFEICVGAILTQNTNWGNVETAILCLKEKRLLEPKALAAAALPEIEKCVRPSGYFRQKARRIRDFARCVVEFYERRAPKATADLLEMRAFFVRPLAPLRAELLSMKGIGPETADSMLLYAGGKPVFVVDAYTRRLCRRLPLPTGSKYEEIRSFFENNISKEIECLSDMRRGVKNYSNIVEMFNEFHALIVALAKKHCKKKPECACCPLEKKCSKLIL